MYSLVFSTAVLVARKSTQMTRRSHLVSLCTASQFMSQYGIAHFLHLYFPQYPQTEHSRRGGSRGGDAPAVK